MEFLKEAMPKAAVLAVLWNANDQLGVREPDDFAAAFTTMTRRRPDAMFLVADGLTTTNRKRIVELAATQRIPAMYEWNFIVREGGLTCRPNNRRSTTLRSISRRQRCWD